MMCQKQFKRHFCQVGARWSVCYRRPLLALMKAGKQVAQIPLGWLNGDKTTAAKILLQTMERLMKDSFTKAFVFFLRHYKGALPQVVGGGVARAVG